MKQTWKVLTSLLLATACLQRGIQRQEQEEYRPEGEVHDSIKGGAYDAGAKGGSSTAGFQESNLTD